MEMAAITFVVCWLSAGVLDQVFTGGASVPKRRRSRMRALCVWLANRARKRGRAKLIRHYGDSYLARFKLHRNWLFGIYLHRFIRHDVDEEHHSHPWWFAITIGLVGCYLEHFLTKVRGVLKVKERVHGPWRVRALGRKSYHRVDRLLDREVWTLFIVFGPSRPDSEKDWYFKHPVTGKTTHFIPFTRRHHRRIAG